MKIETIGVRGGSFKTDTKGFVEVSSKEFVITIDDFEGSGASYKEREESLFTFSKDGQEIIQCTLSELVKHLQANKV